MPAGTWHLDATHSSAGFAVKHMGVSTFRSRFEQLDAQLTVTEDGPAELVGTVRSDSIVVKDENFQAHLRASDFFDSGIFGAVWAQAELRKVLAAAGARVLDRELPIGSAYDAFNADGTLSAREHGGELANLLAELLAHAGSPVAA